jgi:DNA primase
MGRIIFPLTDQRGATVGFGGRTIDTSTQAKYLNSSDSPIFNKRKILFGLKQLRISNDTILVVEGYFDVLTLHQAGFTYTVGLLGTEITSEQAAILKTFARNAILIFDGDAGGQAALLRALKTPSLNLNVKAVILPSGDPDEMVRDGLIGEFEALIEKARPIQEAAIEIIVRRKETESIALLTDEVTRLGAEIPDPLDACRFIDEVAQALNVPVWALQEKTHLKRDKKERLIERKKQLEKFVVHELLAHPGIIPCDKLESIKDLFDDNDQKQILLTRILKHA